ncbi:hypothetical protein MSAN_02138100 [Mycena sanguinolenta]|uniref:Uncharacterized protein n=1 Tax=Mycena sanguinolenta TaxID=230812 RepID=A0A8H7CLP0_9AGAR|nr:hypothetical protein MSAN_02138100 [Mycena sanguinolenta]
MLHLTCRKNQDFREAFKYIHSEFQRTLYHSICVVNLGQHRPISISDSNIVNLGTVFHCSSNPLEDSVDIAFLPNAEAPYLNAWRTFEGGTGKVMPDGWTRFQSNEVFNNTLYIALFIVNNRFGRNVWLSQANHIFRRLHIMSNFEDYVVVDYIRFDLEILGTTGDFPEDFLFLCPREDFRTSTSSARWPACAAYWSLDPSGADRLSSEDAARLGFPFFDPVTGVYGLSWDASVYDGLRQFHEAKGFDPYSQNVARHLGHSLYHLSSKAEAPLANVDSGDEHFDADIDSDHRSGYTECESEHGSTSACDDSDLDIDTGSSYIQEIVPDPAGENCRLEHAESSNCDNHNASESTVEEDMMVEEMFAPSRSLNLLMSIQLVSILFLGLCNLC